MVETLRASFKIHSYDVDAFGCLGARSLAGFLQEAASQSADALGFGISDLNRKGLTWVLVREQFELDCPIKLGERVEVETWPSGIARRAALRDFRIFQGGKEMGRALTTWLALDVASRHPVRLQDVLPPAFHPEAPHVLPVSGDPMTSVDSAPVERKFRVRYSDIDINSHVTNASYVEWLVEAIDEETWRHRWLSALDIQFLSECSLGSQVISRSSGAGAQLLHSVAREEDGKELTRARSSWAPR